MITCISLMAGLKRKFNADAYVKKIQELEKTY